MRRLLIASFCACIVLPVLVQRALPGRWEAVRLENREPRALPDLPATGLEWTALPQALDAWHADTFGARDELLRWHHAQTLLGFGAAPTPTLLLGQQGWIFFTGDHSREAWLGRESLTPGHIDEWSQRLEARIRYFGERGIDYRFAIAPNKETIYPEFLPACEWRSGPTPLEQWLAGLSPAARACVLDLRPALFDEKRFDDPAAGDFVYFPHGTHWTERAAWRVSRELAPTIPGREALQRVRDELDPGDTWAINLNLLERLRQPVWNQRWIAPLARCTTGIDRHIYMTREAHWERPGSDPRLLLVTDSFGPLLPRYLAEGSRELYFRWRPRFPMEALIEARPERIVELQSERRILYSLAPLETGLIGLEPRDWGARQPLGAVRVEGHPRARYQDGQLALEPGRDKLLLQAPVRPAGTRLSLRLFVEAPAEGIGYLWYQTGTEREFTQLRRYPLPIVKGLNELCFELDNPEVLPELMWAPGSVSGEYRVLEAQARAR
jgi:hypothetical protein